MSALTELIVEDEGWSAALPDLEILVDDASQAALTAVGLDPADYSISLLACDDARIAALNHQFRDRQNATNVLSWPAFEITPGTPPPKIPEGRTPLGDLALALQTCVSEAQDAQRPLKNHAKHLIIHGCLHLLGYDHQTDADADIMEGIERRALAEFGIPDPYA